MNFRQFISLLIATSLVFCLGCQLFDSESVELVLVGGEVVMDGKPLADAKVLFVPFNKNLGNRFATSHAITDGDGKFELQLSDKRAGAYAGWHYVLISKTKDRAATNSAELEAAFDSGDFKFDETQPALDNNQNDIVPRYYNVETELKFEVVPGDRNDAKFELSSVDPLLK